MTDEQRIEQLKRFGGNPAHTWRTHCARCGKALPPASWKPLCGDCVLQELIEQAIEAMHAVQRALAACRTSETIDGTEG